MSKLGNGQLRACLYTLVFIEKVTSRLHRDKERSLLLAACQGLVYICPCLVTPGRAQSGSSGSERGSRWVSNLKLLQLSQSRRSLGKEYAETHQVL